MLTDEEKEAIYDDVATTGSWREFANAIERAVLAKAGEQKAIDENANERGEPDAIYLQLHDPDSFDDTEKDDFRADGVTWCWHSISENDVRYIREDLANPLPAQAIPEWMPISTAPKDGAVIMVCGGTYGCAVDPWPVDDRPLEKVAFVHWSGDFFETGNDDDFDHYNPEYWMPVPAPKKP